MKSLKIYTDTYSGLMHKTFQKKRKVKLLLICLNKTFITIKLSLYVYGFMPMYMCMQSKVGSSFVTGKIKALSRDMACVLTAQTEGNVKNCVQRVLTKNQEALTKKYRKLCMALDCTPAMNAVSLVEKLAE